MEYINRCVGVDLDAPAIAELLSRMALTADAVRDGHAVSVEVPPTRSDVLHACDVMEVGAPEYPYILHATNSLLLLSRVVPLQAFRSVRGHPRQNNIATCPPSCTNFML